MLEELPTHEPILQWAMNNFKGNRELRNYWYYYSWGSKHRHHGQFNGRKPTWRKHRKQEKQFKEVQISLIPKNIL